MKLKIVLCIISLIVSKTSYTMEKSKEDTETIIKRFAAHIDTKVIDATILTLCTTTGAQLGHSLNILILDKYYGVRQTNYHMRIDDDFGWWIGGVTGAELGHFFIKLRHQVTDPLCPAIYGLCTAGMSAGKVWLETKVQGGSQFMCNKINGITNSLKQYANQKAK